ncbi:MAG TPA: 3'(2'),5'-bisphosphate nucleotidase CysQ [Stellaceae bacterium]|nr:3'(2'),5'-bisphosphate nucleotidase CysQ [Stellaceae bacterium]
MDDEHRRLLDLARRAAHAAGSAILEIYRSDFAVRIKDDRSPVTLADERAEAIIIAALSEGAPEIPIIAEEQTAAQGAAAPPPPRFWLVDPLDGTREFVKRNGEFTVNIALVEGQRVVLGVVHLPVADVTYAGAGPGSATRQSGNEAPAAIAARPLPAFGAVVLHSRSHAKNEDVYAYTAWLTAPEYRAMGSSAKFCLVAEGTADIYPRFGPTMEWDTGAGQAVLEAAGGKVMRFPENTKLAYAKPDYRNPSFVAMGSGG